MKRHDSLSLHSIAFCVRSHLGQQREHLESSSGHYGATVAVQRPRAAPQICRGGA